MKINELDSSIYTKIAAGEVVDEPAGVVKELVENSIDSGATKIVIDIEEGGVKKIRVTDNGSGIERSEIKKAFLPHATSKISEISDLYSIKTLGFRGEALSSIASVSRLSVLSKVKDAESGTYLEVDGGVFGEIEERAAVDGTTITVSNLFYNVPARLKFLRKKASEEHDINKVVNRFILGNPKIQFTYIVDGSIKFQTTSGFLIDALRTIYDNELVENLLKISSEVGDISVNGYISGPNYSKNNSTYQSLFVNGRSVECPELMLAVRNAYYDVLMRGKFPVFVLYANLPYDKVDINVHPKKSLVKFENSSEIFGVIYKAVRRALTSVAGIVKLDKTPANEIVLDKQPLQTFDYSQGSSFGINGKVEISNDERVLASILSRENNKVNSGEAEETKKDELAQKFKSMSSSEDVKQVTINFNKNGEKISVASKSEIFDKMDKLEEKVSLEFAQENKSEQDNFLEEDYKVCGVLFNTYIVIEKGQEVFFIDQHAAHERLLYDKFIEAFNSRQIFTQPLLMPFVLTVNDEENEFILSCIEDFKQMGFDIAVFGNNSFKISYVPVFMANISLKRFFDDVLSDLNIFKTKNEKIKDFFALKACKAAVKGGDSLSKEEIETLLKMISETNSPLHCPHGRPYVVNFTKDNLEKWFKRQV